MVEEADVNGDGEIDYKEFMALVADTKLTESKSPIKTEGIIFNFCTISYPLSTQIISLSQRFKCLLLLKIQKY